MQRRDPLRGRQHQLGTQRHQWIFAHRLKNRNLCPTAGRFPHTNRQKRRIVAQQTTDDEETLQAVNRRDRHTQPGGTLANGVNRKITLPHAMVDAIRTQRAP